MTFAGEKKICLKLGVTMQGMCGVKPLDVSLLQKPVIHRVIPSPRIISLYHRKEPHNIRFYCFQSVVKWWSYNDSVGFGGGSVHWRAKQLLTDKWCLFCLLSQKLGLEEDRSWQNYVEEQILKVHILSNRQYKCAILRCFSPCSLQKSVVNYIQNFAEFFFLEYFWVFSFYMPQSGH